MKNIRIGNDIWFKWQILREEGVETWDGKDIKVTLRDSYGMECAVDWRKDEGGVISGVCRGRAQKRLGLYTLTLTENDGKDNMGCVDSVDAWRLVARQNASIIDEEERDGALGVEVVMLTSKVGIGTGEGITIDTELNEESGNAIANSAVTKGINAVGEISEQDLQEVVGVSAGTGGDVPSTKPKKRKEQIIIGKAIKPKACDIGNVDNWYVFHTPTIPVYDYDLAEGCEVFLDNEQLKRISELHDSVLLYAHPLKTSDLLVKIKVLKYEESENGITALWLTGEIINFQTVKDSTSKRFSWVQGKRVYHNYMRSQDLASCLTKKYTSYYDIYVIRNKLRCRKVREIKGHRQKRVWSRRRAVKVFKAGFDSKHYRVRPGLYKCRVNSFGRKSEWQYFYARFKEGNPKGDITVKEIK